MRWPTTLQAQLIASANAVDRANRPTLFVLLPSIAVVAALIVLLLILAQFKDARRALQVAQNDMVSLTATMEDRENLRAAQPDLATLFPQNAMMDNIIENAAEAVWGADPTGLPVSVGQPDKRAFVATQSDLIKTDVSCTMNRSVSLTELANWIGRVLADAHLKGVFLSKLELRPGSGGWEGIVVFRRYEYISGGSKT